MSLCVVVEGGKVFCRHDRHLLHYIAIGQVEVSRDLIMILHSAAMYSAADRSEILNDLRYVSIPQLEGVEMSKANRATQVTTL